MKLTKFITLWSVFVISDFPETQLEDVSKETSPHNVELTNNTTIFTKCVFAEKTTTESMASANSQLPAAPTHTGTVLDVSVKLDSFSKRLDVFSLPIRFQYALLTPNSTVLPVFVKLGSMKFQDISAKDVQMAKSGTAPNATGIPPAKMDIFGMHNTEDVTPRLSNALKTLNGTVPYASAI